MPEDTRGVEVSACSAQALAAADAFNRRLVRLDSGCEELLPAQQREPEDPLLNLYTGLLHLYAQSEQGRSRAGTHFNAVRQRETDLTPRDKLLLTALEQMQAGQHFAAQAQLEALTEAFPNDILSVKVCEYVYYLLGQQQSGERFRAHLSRLAASLDGDPDYLGMRAFAHGLSDDLEAAKRDAHAAIDREPRNPWAQHALSHALIRQGLAEEGIREMEAFMPLLKTCERLIVCHDGWHLALLYLEQGDTQSAERVFHETVWPHTPDMVAEQIDAIAFAWRMDMAGYPLETFWADVATHAVPYSREAIIPFISAHFAYAFARAGRTDELSALTEAATRRAAGDDEEARRIWQPVGEPLVKASAAFARGDAATAIAGLAPAIDALPCIGGSDAQVDLFRTAYAHGLVQLGRNGEANKFIANWLTLKDRTPLDSILFARE